MAQTKPSYIWAFIFAAIICHDILFTQGRQLKPTETDGVGKTVASTKESFPPPNSQSIGLSLVEEPINDFRPTRPGSSPGIGHFHAERNVVVEPNGAGNTVNLFSKESKQEATGKPNVHSIEDGNNMGKHGSRSINSEKTAIVKKRKVQGTSRVASHTFEHRIVSKKGIIPPPNPKGYSAVAEPTDDFRPTTPGSSPGVGHSQAEIYVEIQQKGIANGSGLHHSITGSTKDFRPTEPGHSPGVGHSIAGSTNDFRPTEPGHSPGVGHSFKDKNTEPNA